MKIWKNSLQILFVFLCSHTLAENFQVCFTDTINKSNVMDQEINGMLVDNTQTKLGKEFYELFYNLWSPPTAKIGYSIMFEEKPGRGFGAQISVIINDLTVFQQFIQPRYETIEMMVQLAMENSLNYFEYFAQIQEELNYEELKGNGIF